VVGYPFLAVVKKAIEKLPFRVGGGTERWYSALCGTAARA